MIDLFKYTKGYRLLTFLTPLLVICEVVLEVIIPSLMGNIVNSGIVGRDLPFIRHQSVLMVACAVFSLIFGVAAGLTSAKAATGFTRNLRVAIFDRIQLFSFGSIDRFKQGGLVTRLTTDAFFVQVAFQNIIRIGIRLPIMLISALIMSMRINRSLAGIYLIALPVLVVCLAVISAIAMPKFRKAFDQIDVLNSSTQENLHGIKVVKSFAREGFEKKKFDSVVTSLYRKLVGAEKTMALTNPTMRTVAYSCLIVIALFASKRIAGGEMQAGHLMALYIYNFQILFSMMMFAMIISIVIMCSTCYGRIKEVLHENLDIANCDNPLTNVADGSIEFRNVDFSFEGNKDKLALKDVSISIGSGQRIGITGPTGSGKSALVGLIARLYDVTVGSVSVGGNDVRDYDLKVLRDSVSVVLQKNNLFSGTLRSSLSWGKSDASDKEIWDALKIAQASDFVLALPGKLDYEVAQQGGNFSGGQRQRLCIARALLKSPKILIMDDSFSALDTATDERLRKSLHNDRPELTKIIIAHKVLSIMDCDKIVVMKEGHVENIGTHEELLSKSEFYRDLYESQLKSNEVEGLR
ncbi:MAG TPA: ABC transporter [Spirochaetaceae bacterium]|nr:ABC transporter [Spirochaetaceae bacterium]